MKPQLPPIDPRFFKALLFPARGASLRPAPPQDTFHGGLKKNGCPRLLAFLAGALCLAGFPLTGGFFSKDAILAALFEREACLRHPLRSDS